MIKEVDKLLEACLFKVAKEIGPRPLGSPANRRTRDYILGELTRLGLPVSVQEVSEEYSYASSSEVRIVGMTAKKLDSWPAFASCATSELIAPVVHCGCGTPDEIPSQIRGAIGLVRRGAIHEEVKIRNLKTAGAVGALLYVDFENALYSARVSKRISAIPAAIIRKADAQDMIQATLGTLTVSLTIEAQMRVAKCINIIVDLVANGQSHTVICAHYDSRPSTAGANDNAAGVACLVALVASLGSLGRRATLRFVFFDGEELGLVGSRAYAESKWVTGCERVINIDAIGAGRLSLLTKDREGELDNQLISLAMEAARELGIGIKTAESRTGSSDHAPLRKRGARALWFSDHPNTGRETDIDIAESVNIQELKDVYNIVSRLLDLM